MSENKIQNKLNCKRKQTDEKKTNEKKMKKKIFFGQYPNFNLIFCALWVLIKWEKCFFESTYIMLKNYGIIIILSLEFISGHFSKNVTVFTLKMAKNTDFGPFCNTPPTPQICPKFSFPFWDARLIILLIFTYMHVVSAQKFFLCLMCVYHVTRVLKICC